MPIANCDPCDRFAYQYLTLMIDCFLAHLWAPKLELNQDYLNMCRIHVSQFDFDVIFVTSRLTTKLRDVHYNRCFEERAGHFFIRPTGQPILSYTG